MYNFEQEKFRLMCARMCAAHGLDTVATREVCKETLECLEFLVRTAAAPERGAGEAEVGAIRVRCARL